MPSCSDPLFPSTPSFQAGGRKPPPSRPRTIITYRVRPCLSTVCPLFPIRERRMTEIKHEPRSVVVPAELRAKGDSGQTIAGYAAIFGETADIGGYFRESIAKGAFAVSIASDAVPAYFYHDRGRLPGDRKSAGQRKRV